VTQTIARTTSPSDSSHPEIQPSPYSLGTFSSGKEPSGPFQEIEALIAQGKLDEALQRAVPFRKQSLSAEALVKRIDSARLIQHAEVGVGLMQAFFPGANGAEAPDILKRLSERIPGAKSLKAAFAALSQTDQAELQSKIGEDRLSEILAISEYRDSEGFWQAAANFGIRLKQADQLQPAMGVLGMLSQGGIVPESYRQQAEDELNAIVGKGEGKYRAEFLVGQFSKQATDLKTIVPMIAGSAVFSLGNTAILGRLAMAKNASGWWARGLGARAIAGTLAFTGEVGTFYTMSKGMASLYGESTEGAGVGKELLGTAMTLGTLKLFGFLGNQAFIRAHGVSELGVATQLQGFSKVSQALFPQVSQFMGMMASHKLEENLGLRPHVDGATTVMDTVSSMVSLGVGGHLGHKVLGSHYAAFEKEMGMRAKIYTQALENRREKSPSAIEWLTNVMKSPHQLIPAHVMASMMDGGDGGDGPWSSSDTDSMSPWPGGFGGESRDGAKSPAAQSVRPSGFPDSGPPMRQYVMGKISGKDHVVFVDTQDLPANLIGRFYTLVATEKVFDDIPSNAKVTFVLRRTAPTAEAGVPTMENGQRKLELTVTEALRVGIFERAAGGKLKLVKDRIYVEEARVAEAPDSFALRVGRNPLEETDLLLPVATDTDVSFLISLMEARMEMGDENAKIAVLREMKDAAPNLDANLVFLMAQTAMRYVTDPSMDVSREANETFQGLLKRVKGDDLLALRHALFEKREKIGDEPGSDPHSAVAHPFSEIFAGLKSGEEDRIVEALQKIRTLNGFLPPHQVFLLGKAVVSCALHPSLRVSEAAGATLRGYILPNLRREEIQLLWEMPFKKKLDPKDKYALGSVRDSAYRVYPKDHKPEDEGSAQYYDLMPPRKELLLPEDGGDLSIVLFANSRRRAHIPTILKMSVEEAVRVGLIEKTSDDRFRYKTSGIYLQAEPKETLSLNGAHGISGALGMGLVTAGAGVATLLTPRDARASDGVAGTGGSEIGMILGIGSVLVGAAFLPKIIARWKGGRK